MTAKAAQKAVGFSVTHTSSKDTNWDFQHAVEFDEEGCRWKCLGDSDSVFVGDTRRSIIKTLEDGCHLPSAIQRHSGLSETNTEKALKRMVEKGQIKKTSRGHFDLVGLTLEPVEAQSELPGCQDGERT